MIGRAGGAANDESGSGGSVRLIAVIVTVTVTEVLIAIVIQRRAGPARSLRPPNAQCTMQTVSAAHSPPRTVCRTQSAAHSLCRLAAVAATSTRQQGSPNCQLAGGTCALDRPPVLWGAPARCNGCSGGRGTPLRVAAPPTERSTWRPVRRAKSHKHAITFAPAGRSSPPTGPTRRPGISAADLRPLASIVCPCRVGAPAGLWAAPFRPRSIGLVFAFPLPRRRRVTHGRPQKCAPELS